MTKCYMIQTHEVNPRENPSEYFAEGDYGPILFKSREAAPPLRTRLYPKAAEVERNRENTRNLLCDEGLIPQQ